MALIFSAEQKETYALLSLCMPFFLVKNKVKLMLSYQKSTHNFFFTKKKGLFYCQCSSVEKAFSFWTKRV